jgi:hypothetical protein
MITRVKRRAGSIIRQTLVRLLPGICEQIMQLAAYYPHVQSVFNGTYFQG